ncbi:MAG: glycosyltransferase family 9 protein [Candidatus Kuenenia sp.]|nr:glycosyltransferase family 9 protein [Candidatus Kuenenia hertensis]
MSPIKKHILIIRPSAIGDIIITLPTLHALRNHIPNSHIEIMGYPSYLELVHGRFYADTISRFDHPDISILLRKDARIPDSLRERFSKFDLIIAFIADRDKIFSENLQASGAKEVLCYNPFPNDSKPIHIIDHFLNSLKLLEIPYSNTTPNIYLNKEDLIERENILRNSLENTRQKRIAIHPGSGSTHKCWLLSNYFSIIQWLTEHHNAKIFIIAGPADIVVKQEIDKLPKNNICAIDTPPLTKLAAILQQCDLFIGNDSGITHLAAAMGVSTLAIFGPTDPKVWGPRGKSVKICYHPTPCSPCSDEKRKNCFPKTCLESITTKMIKEEILRFLSL